MAKIRVNLSMDSELHEQIKAEADRKGVSVSGYISFVVAEKMEQNKAIGVMGELLEQVKVQEAKEKEKQAE